MAEVDIPLMFAIRSIDTLWEIEFTVSGRNSVINNVDTIKETNNDHTKNNTTNNAYFQLSQ